LVRENRLHKSLGQADFKLPYKDRSFVAIKMKIKRHSSNHFALAILTGILAFTGVATAQTNEPAHRFEPNVRLYETADISNAPPTNAILLAGDSQFYRWKTVHEDLAGYTVINRGIDGFETSDLLYFADHLVLPYHARLIILHIGGNDVHDGKTPDQVLADFKALVAKIRAVQPTVPIAFSSLTPGPARLAEFAQRKATNRVLKNYIATQPNLLFIDLWDAMLTPDGQPRPDLWVADGIHPNHAGYQLRVQLMRPLLGPPDKKSP
jgi:lysophospholipase L1-like esterase